MPRGVAFDDLLDEKLAAEPIDPKPTVTFGPAGMATAYGFFFVETPRTAVASFPSPQAGWMGRRAGAGIVGLDARFAGAVNAASVRVRVQVTSEPTMQPVARTRAVRQLPAREQQALTELVTLGGTLSGEIRRRTDGNSRRSSLWIRGEYWMTSATPSGPSMPGSAWSRASTRAWPASGGPGRRTRRAERAGGAAPAG